MSLSSLYSLAISLITPLQFARIVHFYAFALDMLLFICRGPFWTQTLFFRVGAQFFPRINSGLSGFFIFCCAICGSVRWFATVRSGLDLYVLLCTKNCMSGYRQGWFSLLRKLGCQVDLIRDLFWLIYLRECAKKMSITWNVFWSCLGVFFWRRDKVWSFISPLSLRWNIEVLFSFTARVFPCWWVLLALLAILLGLNCKPIKNVVYFQLRLVFIE